MKTLSSLIIGAMMLVSPLALAGHKDHEDCYKNGDHHADKDKKEKKDKKDKKKDDDVCEYEDCNYDLRKAIKDLTKETKRFGDKIEDTEWESEFVFEYLDELYSSAKKLEKKAKKYDSGKKLKKYFKDVEEAFEYLVYELDEVIVDYKHECRKDKSAFCEAAKDAGKAFSKLEDAYLDVEDEI